ncbi:hypothetical protein AVEN_172974-1 [Araneus ventricosus]|uniref:Uncharacterized protein n=1 Tax=Araneus ventricosus TaxID=182803 RepID=A0A4Y2FY49_ARAVE|nr:hypothetical protein AVEN_172974-1 [Araneus ventricosus]
MFCVSAFRVSSLAVIKLFFLFELFRTTVCESSGNLQSDNFLNQEVADFQNFFEEKLSNQGPHTDILNLEVGDFQKFLEEKLSNQGPHTDHQENVLHLQQGENLPPFSNDDWDTSSDESGDFSYEDVQEPIVPRNNEKPQLTSAENVPQFNPLHEREDSSGQRDPLNQNNGGAHEVQGTERRKEETKNHPLEILFIRESDSKLKDPLADILEEVLSPKKSIDKSIEPKEPYPVSERPLSKSLNEELSLQRPDTCSTSNHSFYDRQTCSSGYQYRLEPHLSDTYSADLKAQMLERYSPPKQTVCGFQRRMKPDKDVTERALCPFQWEVSKRNPSRIPEYLYEAKCSCTDSCAELKSKIRVLWRVGCEDQLHVYREGWEEIAVACVPTKPPITRSKKAHRVKVTTPHN